jgi:Fic family protein
LVPRKPSTKAGFAPGISATEDLRTPALDCVRLDGRLDEVRERAALQRMHMLLLRTTRLGNLVSSHQIEGLPVTTETAQKAIESKDTLALGALEEDLRRFARAYEKFHLAEKPPRLTVNMIRDLHGSLFTKESLEEGAPGEFKDEPNGVKDKDTGQFVFHATPVDDTVPELEALIAWCDGPALQLPPALAAGLFFHEFETIHPFMDGNGRLGRLLNLIALRHFGLRNAFLCPVDTRFRKRRDAYYESLAAANLGTNYQVWLRFYTKELRKAYEEANERRSLRAILDLPTKPSSREVLEWIVERPDPGWFKRADFPNPSDLSANAITGALAELVALGLLEHEGERRGSRYQLDQAALQKRLLSAEK